MPGERLSDLASIATSQLEASARVKHEMTAQSAVIVDIARLIADALQQGNKVLFCGNGGSAADAQHLAAELVGRFLTERRALPGIALTANSSVVTAIGNDYGFDQVFARQVAALGKPGDVLVAISTSGRSRNVLAALEEARRRSVKTVVFTGPQGPAKDMADYVVAVPTTETPRIQEAHTTVGHVICALVDQILAAHDAPR